MSASGPRGGRHHVLPTDALAMISRNGVASNAQRKGGPKPRSHNEDRFKGTVTGVAIPEGQRGSDGIEDFENLLEANYDQNRPLQLPRNMRQKSPNTLSKSAPSGTEKDVNNSLDRPVPRSRPSSAMGPPSARATDVNYAPIPSPRAATSRLGYATTPLVSGLRNAPPYDPTNDLQLPTRSSQGFGALGRYQDEPVDSETVMDQYVNYEYGDTPSPAPDVDSSPPQVARKSLVSPNASRSNRKSAAPGPSDENAPEYSDKPPSSRQAKGNPRATPEGESTPVNQPPRKSIARDRDAEEVEQDLEPEAEQAPYSRTPRRYGGERDQVSPPFDEAAPPDDGDQQDPLLDYQDAGAEGGEYYEEGDEFPPPDGGRYAEPPRSVSERSDGESEVEAPPKKPKSKVKEKEAQKSKKKRPLEDGEDSPVQTKRAKSTSIRPSSRARSKTPMADESYLEEIPSDSEISDEEDEDIVRRSRRVKYAPVKYWLGEKLEYDTYRPGSNRQVPKILGVRRVPEPQAAPLSKRKRRPQQKARSKSRRLETEERESELPRGRSVAHMEEGWDAETRQTGIVIDYKTNEEVRKTIVYTAGMLDPQPARKGEFLSHRLFDNERWMAAGYLIIPPNGEKPRKPTKDNIFVFFLIEGAIYVKIHETEFYLGPGGIFFVPRGNFYFIRNMRNYPAKLCYFQSRLVTQEEFEERARSESILDRPRSASRPRQALDEYRRSLSRGGGFDSSSPQKRSGESHHASTSRRR